MAAATPQSQVRSPAYDESPQTGRGRTDDPGARLDLDDSHDEEEEEESELESSVASVNTEDAERDLKVMFHAATAPPDRGTTPQTVAGWCAAPLLALVILVAGMSGTIAYLGTARREAFIDVAFRLAVRGAAVSAAATDVAIIAGQTPPAAAVLAATRLTLAQHSVGDAFAATLTTTADRTLVQPLHASVFGPMLCAACNPVDRYSGAVSEQWWIPKTPADSSSAIDSQRTASDPAINADSSRALASVTPRAGTGSLSVADNTALQFSVSHDILLALIDSEAPAAFPAAAAAAVALGCGVSWALIIVILEVADRVLGPRWMRGATIGEKEKLEREMNDELDDDESDVPESVVSSVAGGPILRKQSLVRAAVVGGSCFVLSASFMMGAAGLAFDGAEQDSLIAAAAVGRRSEMALVAAAIDTVVYPTVSANSTAFPDARSSTQTLLTTAIQTRDALLPEHHRAATVIEADSTSGELYVRSSDPEGTMAKVALSRAVAIALLASLLAGLAVAVGTELWNPVPMPLTQVLRRTAASSFDVPLSSRWQSPLATMLTLPYFMAVVASLVLLAAAGAVAAGSVVLLRHRSAMLTRSAMHSVATVAADSATAFVGLDGDLNSWAGTIPSSRNLHRLAVAFPALSSGATLQQSWIANFSIEASHDRAALCGSGTQFSKPADADDVNMRLLLSGQPPVTSSVLGQSIVEWGVSPPEPNGHRPRASESTQHGVWTRSIGSWSSAGGLTPTQVFIAVEEDVDATTASSIATKLPDGTERDQNYATVLRQGFSRVAWVPMTVCAVSIGLLFVLGDVLITFVAARFRRVLGGHTTADAVAGGAVCILVFVACALGWPISASVILQQQWDDLTPLPTTAELRVSAETAVSGLAANLAAPVSAGTAVSSLGLDQTGLRQPAATLSATHRRGGAFAVASSFTLGSGSSDNTVAGATSTQLLFTTARQCSTSAVGSASDAICTSAQRSTLLDVARRSADVSSAFRPDSWALQHDTLHGLTITGTGGSGAVRFGYAAKVLMSASEAPTNALEAVLVEQVVIVESGGDPANSDEDAPLRYLAARVIGCGATAITLLLAVAGLMLVPVNSNAFYGTRRATGDRNIKIQGGIYKERGDSPPVPVVRPATAFELLPLCVRRREVWTTLALGGAIALAGATADLSVGFFQRQIDSVARPLATMLDRSFATPHGTSTLSAAFVTAASSRALSPTSAWTDANIASLVGPATSSQAGAATPLAEALYKARDATDSLTGRNVTLVAASHRGSRWSQALEALWLVDASMAAAAADLGAVMAWALETATSRANGTVTDATYDSLWADASSGTWNSTFVASVARASDAMASARMIAATLASATSVDPSVNLASIDSTLRTAATEASLAQTAASTATVALPTSIAQSLTAFAQAATNLRPPVTEADVELVVQQSAAEGGTVTVGTRTIAAGGRQIAEMVFFARSATSSSYSSAMANLSSASASLRALTLDFSNPVGACVVDDSSRTAVSAARNFNDAIRAMRMSFDLDLPLACTLCMSVALTVAGAAATIVRRLEVTHLGSRIGILRPILALLVAGVAAVGFTVGIFTVAEDTIDSMRDSAHSHAPGRAAYAAAATEALHAVDATLFEVSSASFGIATDTSSVRAAALKASAALRALATVFGRDLQRRDSTGSAVQPTRDTTRSPLSASTEQRINAARDALRKIVTLCDTAASATTVRKAIDDELYGSADVLGQFEANSVAAIQSGAVLDVVLSLPVRSAADLASSPVPARLDTPAVAAIAQSMRSATSSTPGAIVTALTSNSATPGGRAAAAAICMAASVSSATLSSAASAHFAALSSTATGEEPSASQKASALSRSQESIAAVASLSSSAQTLWGTYSSGSAVPAQVAAAIDQRRSVSQALDTVAAKWAISGSGAALQAQATFQGTPTAVRSSIQSLGSSARSSGSVTAAAASTFASGLSSASPSVSVVDLAIGSLMSPSVSRTSQSVEANAGLTEPWWSVSSGLEQSLSTGHQAYAALAAALREDATSPWALGWARASETYSGGLSALGAAAGTPTTDAEALRLSTLSAAVDAIQRLTIGGVWAVTATALALAIGTRLIVPWE